MSASWTGAVLNHRIPLCSQLNVRWRLYQPFAFIPGHTEQLCHVLGNSLTKFQITTLKDGVELFHALVTCHFLLERQNQLRVRMLSPPKRSSNKSKCLSLSCYQQEEARLMFLEESVVLGYRHVITVGALDFWSPPHSEFKDEKWVNLLCLRC